jgi:hypothetical protein
VERPRGVLGGGHDGGGARVERDGSDRNIRLTVSSGKALSRAARRLEAE